MPILTDHTDTALMQLLKQEDASLRVAAYMELYDRYHVKLHTWLLRLVKLPELAEDILQDSFLKIWEIRERLNPEQSFPAFIYRIARNRAVKTLQKSASDQLLRNRLMHHFEQHATDPESRLQWQQYQQLLQKAIQQLPGQRRKAFILCRQESKTYEEAAAELGISRNTLKEHLVMAVKDIKAYLVQHGGAELSFVILFLVYHSL